MLTIKGYPAKLQAVNMRFKAYLLLKRAVLDIGAGLKYCHAAKIATSS
jgi:hypothetical protein